MRGGAAFIVVAAWSLVAYAAGALFAPRATLCRPMIRRASAFVPC
jgi:hypothetical protein